MVFRSKFQKPAEDVGETDMTNTRIKICLVDPNRSGCSFSPIEYSLRMLTIFIAHRNQP